MLNAIFDTFRNPDALDAVLADEGVPPPVGQIGRRKA